MDFRVYIDNKGKQLVWLPEAASFYRFSSAHIDALYRHHNTDGNTANNLSDDDRRLIEQLDRVGFLKELSLSATPIRESFKPIITGFRIVLTEACNFACPDCFSTTAIRRNGDRLRSMRMDTLHHVVRQIVPFGREREITLHFFGGEPLLRFDLIKIAVTICEEAVAKKLMTRPRYAVTTNGSVLNNEITDFMREHRFRVGVSVEETKAVHNKIRVQYRQNSPTFDLVSENYQRLIDASVDVHVLVTPQPPIRASFVQSFRELLRQFPMKTVTINTPYKLDSLEWMVSSEYLSSLIECHKIGHDLGIEVESALTPCLAAIAYGTPRRSAQSKIGTEVTAGVDPEGRLVRSTHKWSPFLAVESWEKFEAHVTRAPECLECEARSLCGGPNEEFQIATGQVLDERKCSFYRNVPSAIAKNLYIFDETDEIEK